MGHDNGHEHPIQYHRREFWFGACDTHTQTFESFHPRVLRAVFPHRRKPPALVIVQRDLSSPYLTKTVDSSNGLMLPIFCEATGMLLLAGRCVRVGVFMLRATAETDGIRWL